MKKAIYILLTLLILLFLVTCAYAQDNPNGNTANQSFSRAKQILMRQVYYDHRVTFYCGCGFDERGKITETNGYVPLREWERARRLEWEHAVPA